MLPVITLLERRRAGTGPEVEATAEDVALLPEIRDPLEAQQRR